MAYTKVHEDWHNLAEGTDTPVFAEDIEHMETGISNAADTADNAVALANSAQTAADAAQVAADAAQADADTAQATANAALAAAATEAIQDLIGAMATDSATVNFTYDDTAGTLTAVVQGLTSANISDFAEAARDTLGTALVQGANISIVPNDGADTITIAITGVIPIANGGTNASTADDALVSLGADRTKAAANTFPAAPHSSLYGFHRAMSLMATAPCKIMYVGDSQFEASRINGKISEKLANIFNPQNMGLTFSTPSAWGTTAPGGTTYGLGGNSSVWFTAGAAGLDGSDVQTTRGIQGDALQMTNGQAVQSISFEFDKLTFRWLTPLSVVAPATLTIEVDGVVVQTPSAAAAGEYTYDAGSVASRVVKITSNGTTLFDHVKVYKGNSTAWIQPITAAHTGMDTAAFNGYTDFIGYVTAEAPALVLIETCTNDASASAYYTNMDTLITNIKAACNASIGIILMPATSGDTTWSLFRQAAQRLSDVHGALLIDVGNAIPDLSVSDPFSYTSDGVHLGTTLGRETVANAVIGTLFNGWVEDPTPPDIDPGIAYVGVAGNRRTHQTDFLELDATLVVATGAIQRIPGTHFRVNLSGTGSSASQQESGDLVEGSIGLSTGTTTTGFAGVQAGYIAPVFTASSPLSGTYRMKCPINSSAAELHVCKFGAMGSPLSGTQTDGIWLETPSTVGANWRAVVATGSTGLAGVDTGIAQTAVAKACRWVYDPITGYVYFYFGVSGVWTLVASINTNLPIGIPLYHNAHIQKAGGTTGTTARLLHLDYMKCTEADTRLLGHNVL